MKNSLNQIFHSLSESFTSDRQSGPTYVIHNGITYVFYTNFRSTQLHFYQQAIEICGKDDYLIGTSISTRGGGYCIASAIFGQGQSGGEYGYSLWVKRDVIEKEHIQLFDVLQCLEVKQITAGSRISYRFELLPPKHLYCIYYHVHNPKVIPGSAYLSTGGIFALFRLCDEKDAHALALLLMQVGDLTCATRTPVRGRYVHCHKNRKLRRHAIKHRSGNVTGHEVYLLRRTLDPQTNRISCMEIYRPKDGFVVAKFDGFDKNDIYCSDLSLKVHLKRVVDYLNRHNRTVPTYTYY